MGNIYSAEGGGVVALAILVEKCHPGRLFMFKSSKFRPKNISHLEITIYNLINKIQP